MWKKKKSQLIKKIDAGDPSPNPTTSSHRRWADLPEALLALILDRLYSADDLIAFASSCRSWRSAYAASTGPRVAPILLAPAISRRRRFLQRKGTPHCLLQTLTSKSHRSPIASQILKRSCIGCSHGNLILLAPSRQHAVLADVFTGREVRSPDFPAGSFNFSFGILTMPLASPSCLLLVVVVNYMARVNSILRWKPGSSSSSWLDLKLTNCREITSLIVLRGQVFGLDLLNSLIVFEHDHPQMSLRLLEARLPPTRMLFPSCKKYGQHLFECNGELQVVLFVTSSWMSESSKIEVYRLDTERCMWVKRKSLGKWCLFIDAIGKCLFACPEPTRWGGRENCIYIAEPGFDSWRVIPVDGEGINVNYESPICPWFMHLPEWPSPVWVHPRMPLFDP